MARQAIREEDRRQLLGTVLLADSSVLGGVDLTGCRVCSGVPEDADRQSRTECFVLAA